MNIFGQSRKVSAFLPSKSYFHAIFKINKTININFYQPHILIKMVDKG